MTDEELIETLWKGEVTLSVVVSAAVRIQELVKERDDAEWVEVLRKTYQRAKEAEAKLAECEARLSKAVEALRFTDDGANHGAMTSTYGESALRYILRGIRERARTVLAELEKTE